MVGYTRIPNPFCLSMIRSYCQLLGTSQILTNVGIVQFSDFSREVGADYIQTDFVSQSNHICPLILEQACKAEGSLQGKRVRFTQTFYQ